ncbi:uncharacterized protein LOC119077743 isoform X2 [Bradysia coprophila]|uniref:uncharacterized protein LOC119077743 isoform X2 n=1 Tax=Bradysia coprophila TaxID=38358 RepID=UPI00187DB781|nr:uncharacterized protein LOC119077743 isoform X2 [Bradysia coprophila]
MTKYFVNTIANRNDYTPRYYSSYLSSINRPYRYNIDNNLDIPDYKYRYYTTFTPRTVPPVWSQADRYSFVHGLTFREAAADIRYSTSKVLEDIRSPRSGSVPRCTRAPSVDTDGNWLDSVCHTRRAVSRGRLSQPPSYHNISKCIVY